jgi:hypothetical protein
VNLRFHGRVAATFATRIKARNLNAFATPTMSTRVTNIGASDKRFQQEDRTIYFAFPICRPPKTENLATFHCELARQCGLGIPNLPAAIGGEFGASCTASSATQCRSDPVSSRSLPKTGVFQMSAGDYRLFRSENGQNRSPETRG